MSKRFRKIFRRMVVILPIIFTPVIIYGIYVAPVFLEYGGGSCLTDERKNGSHSDYIRGLKWVKWRYTVVCGIGPPTQDAGNQDYHDGLYHRLSPKPIPPAGEWQRSHTGVQTKRWHVRLDYVAVTLRGQYHARLGWRWDDVDNIYFFSLSIKKIPIDMNLQLQRWETRRYLAECAQHKLSCAHSFLVSKKILSPIRPSTSSGRILYNSFLQSAGETGYWPRLPSCDVYRDQHITDGLQKRK